MCQYSTHTSNVSRFSKDKETRPKVIQKFKKKNTCYTCSCPIYWHIHIAIKLHYYQYIIHILTYTLSNQRYYNEHSMLKSDIWLFVYMSI